MSILECLCVDNDPQTDRLPHWRLVFDDDRIFGLVEYHPSGDHEMTKHQIGPNLSRCPHDLHVTVQ